MYAKFQLNPATTNGDIEHSVPIIHGPLLDADLYVSLRFEITRNRRDMSVPLKYSNQREVFHP